MDEKPPDVGTDGLTALQRAARSGDVQALRNALEVARDALGDWGREGRSALHEAAAAGHVDAVRALLDAGAQPLAPDRGGRTALLDAARAGSEGCVRALLGAVRPPDAFPAKEAEEALEAAFFARAAAPATPASLLRAFFESGVRCRGFFGPKDAEMAAHHGDVESLRTMLEELRGRESNWDKNPGERALVWAAIGGSVPAVSRGRGRDLVADGIDVNFSDASSLSNWPTAVCFAAVKGHLDCVRVFVELGAGLDAAGARAGRPFTPAIVCAGAGGHVATLRFLLEAGADLEAACPFSSMTAALAAARCGHREALELLVSAGCKLEGVRADGSRWSLAGEAAALSHPSVVRLLEARGLAVNLNTSSPAKGALLEWSTQKDPPGGWTHHWTRDASGRPAPETRPPIVHAALRGDVEAVRFLLQRDADVNARDEHLAGVQGAPREKGATALLAAAAAGHVAVVRALLEAGAELGVAMRQGSPCTGQRALEAAIANHHEEIARCIVEAGCDVSEATYTNLSIPGARIRTALELAAEAGLIALVGALLQRGAAGRAAALEAAAKRGDAELAQTLLDSGGLDKGDTERALVAAAGSGSMEVLRLLLDNGASATALVLTPPGVKAGSEAPAFLSFGSPIEAACANGKLVAVRELLAKGADPCFIQQRTPWPSRAPPEPAGPSALELAAACGAAGVVRLLAERGAPVDRPGSGLPSALGLALAGRHSATARALLALGADCRAPRALELSCHPLQAVRASILSANKPSPPIHAPCLAQAAVNNDLSSVRELLGRGCDPNGRDSAGHSALYLALLLRDPRLEGSRRARAAVIRELLARGADPFAKEGPPLAHFDHSACYSLEGGHAAARTGTYPLSLFDLDDLLLLDDLKIALPPATPAAVQALARVLHGPSADPPLARHLIARGVVPRLSPEQKAMPELSGCEFLAPLVSAAVRAEGDLKDGAAGKLRSPQDLRLGVDPLEMLLLALDSGGDPNEGLLSALKSAKMTRLLLERGADVRHGGRNEGAVFAAVGAAGYGAREPGERGLVAVLGLLLEAGADPNVRSAGVAPLGLCAELVDEPEVYRMLLARGANPNVRKEGERRGDGPTPLHSAARRACASAVEVLLKGGADVNMRDEKNQSALLYAAKPSANANGKVGGPADHARCVELLCAAGADVHERDSRGATALLLAAGSANCPPEALGALLRSGADPAAATKAGDTVVVSLAKQGNVEGLQLLFQLVPASRAEVAAALAHSWYKPALRGFLLEQLASGELSLDLDTGHQRDKSVQALASVIWWAVRMEGGLDHGRLALDLLLSLPGPVKRSEIDWQNPLVPENHEGHVVITSSAGKSLISVAPPPGAARLLAGAMRLLQLEGRLEGDGVVDVDVEAGPGGESALACACRHGLHLTALRLARAAPEADLDGRDVEGETALSRAVASGPALLAVCELLISRGADASRTLQSASSATRKMVWQIHPDLNFQAALKRAAKLKDVFISRAGAAPDRALAHALRAALEAAGITCCDPEDPDEGLSIATVVVLVVSAAGVGGELCRGHLAEARRLGRAVYPVWLEKCSLDEQIQGYLLKTQFADLSSAELLASGLPHFALVLSQRLAGGAGPAGDGSAASAEDAEAAAAELRAARCDLEGPRPFVFLWCSLPDAPMALQVARALLHRGALCWAECAGGAGEGAEGHAGADRAAVRCAAFVPLLSEVSLAEPLLRDRLQLAEINKRPLRPVVVATLPDPGGVLGDELVHVFLTHGSVALLANVEAVMQAQSTPIASSDRAEALSSSEATAAAHEAAGAASAVHVQKEASASASASASELSALKEELRRLQAARRKLGEARAAKELEGAVPTPSNPPSAAPAPAPMTAAAARSKSKSSACSIS
eukprot:tig00021489_g21701.t1